jgi:hypothetical protein
VGNISEALGDFVGISILIEHASDPSPEAPPALPPLSSAPDDPASVEPVAITVEFSAGVKVTIDATAPTALVTATLLALQ